MNLVAEDKERDENRKNHLDIAQHLKEWTHGNDSLVWVRGEPWSNLNKHNSKPRVNRG